MNLKAIQGSSFVSIQSPRRVIYLLFCYYFVVIIIIISFGRSISAHFKFEATIDGLEHIFKKLYPLQNVRNLLPFLTQVTESKKFSLFLNN